MPAPPYRIVKPCPLVRRVQGEDLLIEYDTTDDGNHAHTVLRRPRGDFGDDVLAAHYKHAADHERPAGHRSLPDDQVNS